MILLQAIADVPDYERFKAALGWLLADFDHPEGFLRLEVVQSADEPNRVMFTEWWASRAAFEKAFAQYDLEQRAEFLSRAGIDPAALTHELWVQSDIPVVVGAGGASGLKPA